MSSSYNQILKSSAIVGGAQAIDILIRMIRIKLLAVLLGPSGVGLIGLYQSILEWLGKFSGLGIRSSAVRRVAEAHGKGDPEQFGRTIGALRRTCWITGLGGWLLTIAFARPICMWTFGSSERAWAVSLLGVYLLIEDVSGGQSALLQGVRHIGYLARAMVFSSIGGTLTSVLLYYWLGEKGIVPALIASIVITLFFSWWFSRLVVAPKVIITWNETAREAAPLISLGLAFMWAGVLGAGVAFATRGLIIRKYGIDAGGIYQAAWGISGMFAGFILGAMGQDFYPRLTAVAGSNQDVNRLVNEQTEIGTLLALPGLLATLAFSSWVIQIFYTAKFAIAAQMLPWFVIGIFLRVISWPLGFIQLAKGAGKIFAVSETIFSIFNLLFVWFGLKYLGLIGVAGAFAAAYSLYIIVVLYFARQLSAFRWSKSVVKLFGISSLFLAAEFVLKKTLSGPFAIGASLALVTICGMFCLRQLIVRIGPEHRISIMIMAIPGMRRYFSF